VISLSLGGSSSSSTLQNAVTYAYNKGVVVLAAAGNSGRSVEYPAACTNVISVGAVDVNKARASYSC
jgi:subtilisin